MMLDLSCLYDTTKNTELDELREKLDDPSLFSQDELGDLALACLSDLETYTVVMFLATDGYRFQVRPFHRVIFQVLQDVRVGKYTRLIINIPPGFGKTHMLRSWVAQSYQIERRCKFLHLSYSQSLVDDNSSEIKAILNTPIARAISEVAIKTDTTGKQLWKTSDGGVFRASPTGGQVTGFRAGRLGYYQEFDDGDEAGRLGVEVFCGTAWIDDPVKPEDANSARIREKMNRRYPQTIASRLATERVPVVVGMQRIHGSDFTGFLLQGGSGEKWHVLIIPDEIREEDLDPSTYSEFEKNWIYGIPIQHGLPLGPIWPEKLDEVGIAAKRKNDHTYQAQYRQRPKPEGGRMFFREQFPQYQSVDGWDGSISVGNQRIRVDHFMVYGDTAQKKEQWHDYSVLELYAALVDGRIALIDLIRGRYSAPELQTAACAFLDRYEYREHHWCMSWRECKIEDKVSGTGLIQTISNRYGGRVVGKSRNRDKYVRALDAQPHISAGRVLVPENAIWLDDFLTEVEAFSRTLDHDFDDQCDPLFDACEEMLGAPTEADYSQFAGGR